MRCLLCLAASVLVKCCVNAWREPSQKKASQCGHVVSVATGLLIQVEPRTVILSSGLILSFPMISASASDNRNVESSKRRRLRQINSSHATRPLSFIRWHELLASLWGRAAIFKWKNSWPPLPTWRQKLPILSGPDKRKGGGLGNWEEKLLENEIPQFTKMDITVSLRLAQRVPVERKVGNLIERSNVFWLRETFDFCCFVKLAEIFSERWRIESNLSSLFGGKLESLILDLCCFLRCGFVVFWQAFCALIVFACVSKMQMNNLFGADDKVCFCVTCAFIPLLRWLTKR